MKLAVLALTATLACTTAPEYEPECGPLDDTRAHCPGPDCADAWRTRLDCLTDYGADLRIESCLRNCDLAQPSPAPDACVYSCR